MKRKVLIILTVALVGIQFFGIDRDNPAVDQTKDFIAVSNAPEEVAAILKMSCYDCHSDEAAYPWYTYIQPIGWWVKDHINEGKGHLNFSVWADYSKKKAHTFPSSSSSRSMDTENPRG